jgi:hypothetical protein
MMKSATISSANNRSVDPNVRARSLELIADWFDARKVGDRGNQGFRKSTDLRDMTACLEDLEAREIIHPDRTVFLDLGCADGRVNLIASYFVKLSLGIEIDDEFLDEYQPAHRELLTHLEAAGLDAPPDNIHLFEGDSLEEATYQRVQAATGAGFLDVDFFFTYITLHDLFGEMIAQHAAPGSFYMVYEFSKVLPRYDGMELIHPDVGARGIAALYRKPARR